MFAYTSKELFQIEVLFEDFWRVNPVITRNLIFEFLDLDLHKYVEQKRRDIDPYMIRDWGVHKEIIIPYLIVRLMRPKTIVETGTGVGVSDAYILEALNRNGMQAEFYSIGKQSLNMGKFPIGYCIPDELRYGDIVKYYQYPVIIQRILPELLEEIGDVDIFFHDSDHDAPNMYWELETALPYTDVLLVHDVHTNEAFSEFIEDYKLNGAVFQRTTPVRADLGIIF